MKITRRKLMLGTLGTAVLFPASCALRMSFGGYYFSKTYSHLSAKEAVIFASLVEAFIPEQNYLNLPPSKVDTVGSINDFIAIGSPLEQSEIHLLVWGIEHVLPLRSGHFRKFTQLKVEERMRILQKLEFSQIEIPRLLFRGMKTLVCFGYFNTPQVKSALGVLEWCHT